VSDVSPHSRDGCDDPANRSIAGRLRRQGSALFRGCERNETLLWQLSIAFFVVGDIATTLIGLRLPGVSEAGPLIRHVLSEFGLAGVVALKSVFVAGTYVVAAQISGLHRVSLPLGLSVTGVGVTAWNSLIICISASVYVL
jgi:hypothetical protein